jgi:hypothetical protein
MPDPIRQTNCEHMNLEAFQRKLLAAARANPPSDHVPLAFEKRISALIKSRRIEDPVLLWARALWRAVAPCAAVMLALFIWSVATTDSATDSNQSFDDQFVDTMIALDASEETL